MDVPPERCVGLAATALSLPDPAGGGFSFLTRGSEGAVWLARLQHFPRGRLGRTPKGDLQASDDLGREARAAASEAGQASGEPEVGRFEVLLDDMV